MDYSSHLRRSMVCGRALGSLAGNVAAGEGLVQARVAPHFFCSFFSWGNMAGIPERSLPALNASGTIPKNPRRRT